VIILNEEIVLFLITWFLISFFIDLFSLRFWFDSEYWTGGHIILGLLTFPCTVPVIVLCFVCKYVCFGIYLLWNIDLKKR
jgi:hypothetical protein